MERIKTGDKNALVLFAEKHKEALIRMCRTNFRAILRLFDPEDIIQEAFNTILDRESCLPPILTEKDALNYILAATKKRGLQLIEKLNTQKRGGIAGLNAVPVEEHHKYTDASAVPDLVTKEEQDTIVKSAIQRVINNGFREKDGSDPKCKKVLRSMLNGAESSTVIGTEVGMHERTLRRAIQRAYRELRDSEEMRYLYDLISG